MAYVGRVDQLDALDLDFELSQQLKNKLRQACQTLPEWLLVKILPQAELLLELSLNILTILGTQSSVGQKLLGLKLVDDIPRWKLVLWIGLDILPKYLPSIPQQKITMMTLSLAKVINLLIFLHQGHYPTLSRRLLKINLTRSSSNQESRNDVGYDYLSREVFWNIGMQMLAFILPLINWNFMASKRSRIISNPGSSQCCICLGQLICAHQSNCQHHFCYYCLASNMSSTCPICQTSLTKIQPLTRLK